MQDLASQNPPFPFILQTNGFGLTLLLTPGMYEMKFYINSLEQVAFAL